MKQSLEHLTRIAARREKGSYKIEDMTTNEDYDSSKIYWSCFSENDSGHECLLVYAFDRAKFGETCPDEKEFDNPANAFCTIPCSDWK